MSIPVTSLGTEIQEEMKRVRDEVIPAYDAIGLAGQPAIYMMRLSLVAGRYSESSC